MRLFKTDRLIMLNTEITLNFIKLHSEKLLFLALGLVTFYLSINFSKDWVHYQWWFGFVEQKSWANMFQEFNPLEEPLYRFTSKWVGAQLGFTNFVLITTVTFLFIKLHFLRKIVGNALIGTFFYICLYLLLFEGTALRIGYAVSLIIPALYFLKIEKPINALLLVILASFIHLTAVVFIIAFPLYWFRRLNLLVLPIALVALLLFAFDISTFSIIKEWLGLINPRYLLYDEVKLINQNSTGLYFYFIAFFAAVLLVIYYFLKEAIHNDRFTSVIYSVSLSGLICMTLFHDHVAVGARLGELLLVPIVILLSWLYVHFSLHKMHLHQAVLVMVFLMYFCARLLYLYPTLFS